MILNIEKRPWTEEDIEYWLNTSDGTINELIKFNDKYTRLRAGIIVIKDNLILLSRERDKPDEFAIPGGGIEPGETPVEAAIREAAEEVNILITNPQETGYDYCLCEDEPYDWVKNNVPKNKWWYNYYTCLIIGNYAGPYKGQIDKQDLDPAMKNNAKWYKITEVINAPTFKEQWKRALIKFGYYKRALQEDTRSQLIGASRNAGAYINQSRGKNRWDRKKYSKVANSVKNFNQINMDQFFKQDLLEINIPVQGETNAYTVTMKLNGVVAEIAKNIKNNSNKFEYRTVLQALTKIFNTTNVYISCSCPDFQFTYKHYSIINNWGTEDTASDPGPGKGIKNPNNDKGKGCKHCLLVLNNQSWLMKLTSTIYNYINYMSTNMPKPFQKLIFPKLYGIPYDDAIENNLVPEDTKLESEKHIIDVINDWAKNRGKFKPGTNKNPVSNANKDKKEDSTENK